ncbi:MGMT family protein, partial [candidate division WOR-3 bacterium]|nr:MGMT family protein [candidate division WOR-3 bacterium]
VGWGLLDFVLIRPMIPPVKNCEPDRTKTRSCRFGPGWVRLEWRGGKVTRVALEAEGGTDDRELAHDLERVLDGGVIPEYLHVDASRLSGFARRVLGRCAGIRPGRVMTYAELARAVRRPQAARAVGQVMARNPFPLLIPCHRVVGSDYSLRGYRGGLEMKEWLLAREGWRFTASPVAGGRSAKRRG